MLERFDDDAHRRVVVLAQEEARALGHDHIGPEHILLALTRSSGAVSELLVVQGVTRDATRDVVVAISGRSSRPERRPPAVHRGDASRVEGREPLGSRPVTAPTRLRASPPRPARADDGTVDQVFTSLVDDREVLRQAALTILDGPPESDDGVDGTHGVAFRAWRAYR